VLDKSMMNDVTPLEKRGLRWTGVALLGVLGVMALTIVPEWGVLRDPNNPDPMNSPFFDGFVVWILIFFLVLGYTYGRVTGTMKTDRDIIDGMSDALSSLGLYIVLVFFAAQFVAFFGWTNLGAITAVSGAEFIQNSGMSGSFVFIMFILMCFVAKSFTASSCVSLSPTMTYIMSDSSRYFFAIFPYLLCQSLYRNWPPYL